MGTDLDGDREEDEEQSHRRRVVGPVQNSCHCGGTCNKCMAANEDDEDDEDDEDVVDNGPSAALGPVDVRAQSAQPSVGSPAAGSSTYSSTHNPYRSQTQPTPKAPESATPSGNPRATDSATEPSDEVKNVETCPECGGDMVDGKCEDCGYALTDNDPISTTAGVIGSLAPAAGAAIASYFTPKPPAAPTGNSARDAVLAYVQNEANFVSEAQRKYLWSQEPDIAESWAHGEHTAESGHRMPASPGKSVAGPMAKTARERVAKRKKTENKYIQALNAFDRDSGGRFTPEEDASGESQQALADKVAGGEGQTDKQRAERAKLKADEETKAKMSKNNARGIWNRLFDFLTGNSNPEGINQYTGAAGKAKEASRKANGASDKAGTPDKSARSVGAAISHISAATSHSYSADQHRATARRAEKRGDTEKAATHRQAAALHKEAEAAHHEAAAKEYGAYGKEGAPREGTLNTTRRHQATGQFIPPNAGDGKGPTYDAAVQAAASRNDFADDVDEDDLETISGRDRDPSHEIEAVPKGEGINGAGDGPKSSVKNANPEGHNQYTGGDHGAHKETADNLREEKWADKGPSARVSKSAATDAAFEQHHEELMGKAMKHHGLPSEGDHDDKTMGKVMGTYSQLGSKLGAKIHKLANNSNPEGINQYTGAAGAHEASKAAGVATERAGGSQRAMEHGQNAIDAAEKAAAGKGSKENHLRAGEFHEKAAAYHDKNSHSPAHREARDAHLSAAQLHFNASAMAHNRRSDVTQNFTGPGGSTPAAIASSPASSDAKKAPIPTSLSPGISGSAAATGMTPAGPALGGTTETSAYNEDSDELVMHQNPSHRTANSNPEGINQYTGGQGGGKGIHPTSKVAHQATQKANRYSNLIGKSDKTGTYEASKAHRAAAALHESAAAAVKPFSSVVASKHEEKAAAHKQEIDRMRPRAIENRRTDVGKPTTLREITGNSDEEECPECGGEMRDGRCEECGYEEDTENRRRVDNAFPPGPQHQASREAAGASVMTEHPEARDHGIAAMDKSAGGDSAGARDSHMQAARTHDKAATSAREDGDEQEASEHDNAAMMHRRAASVHRANPIEQRQEVENRRRQVRNAGKCEKCGGKLGDGEVCPKCDSGINNASHRGGQPTGGANVAKVTIGGVTRSERAWLTDQVVANEARKGFKLGNVNYVYNEQGKLVRVNNDGGSAAADAPGKRGTVQAGGEEEDDADEEGNEFASRRGKGLEGGLKFNREQTEAMNQIIAKNRQTRNSLIGQIVANVVDKAKRERMVANLGKLSTEDLHIHAEAVAPQGMQVGLSVFNDEGGDLNFAGAAGGDAGAATTNAESDEGVLDLPTMNYADLAAQNAQERASREAMKTRVG